MLLVTNLFNNVQHIKRSSMKFSPLFCLLSTVITSFSFAQSLRENLDYINNQCGKYSTNNTVFNIDLEHKALVIYDYIGTALFYLKDVEFGYDEESKASLEIKCVDEDECIDQIKTNGDDESYEKYAIVLDGANLKKVLQKLNEIKDTVLNE